MSSSIEAPDWSSLPAPVDDGAARHLPGKRMPPVALPATDGGLVDFSKLPDLTVLYAYPLTGTPGAENPPGWDLIPGARGCTPQSCSFRDHFSELRALGVARLFGLSTQDVDYQREAAGRLHLPFSLLSDASLALTRALDLPTFETAGMVLLKRFTLVLSDGLIERVFYPIFPPDAHAEEVITWLAGRSGVATAVSMVR